MRGVIDQLDIQDDGCLLLVEHKTRRHASLPSQAQQRGTALQVMMYCHLLEGLGQLLEGDASIIQRLSIIELWTIVIAAIAFLYVLSVLCENPSACSQNVGAQL